MLRAAPPERRGRMEFWLEAELSRLDKMIASANRKVDGFFLTHELAPHGETMLDELLSAPPMPLGPGQPEESRRAALMALDPATMFGTPTQNLNAAKAALAGLWLRHGFWEESHNIAQDLQTPEGSYWHAIQHRREPDAWNSKYWFRQVASHPVVAQVATAATALGLPSSPAEFVDYCETHRGTTKEAAAIALQEQEWQLLFDYCRQLALGGSGQR
ncbi:MAG: hypothetical protein ACRC8S_08630 [Fimbriiglobus sp.]